MKPARHLLAIALLAVAAPVAGAAETDPLPVPQNGSKARAVELYNEGVPLLLARRFTEAQVRFESALQLDEELAEAHNNLAFALRMQGTHHFQRSRAHYDRAIALKPTLAQAYMYRGMLLLQQGERELARRDLEQLRRLDVKLAEELQRAVDRGTARERSGISPQY